MIFPIKCTIIIYLFFTGFYVRFSLQVPGYTDATRRDATLDAQPAHLPPGWIGKKSQPHGDRFFHVIMCQLEMPIHALCCWTSVDTLIKFNYTSFSFMVDFASAKKLPPRPLSQPKLTSSASSDPKQLALFLFNHD